MECVKVRYHTRRQARTALDAIQAKPRFIVRKLPVRYYRCPHCQGWHLTSSVHRRFMRG